MAAENDPLIVFERSSPPTPASRLENAVAAGECPAKPDEVDALTAQRASSAPGPHLATAAEPAHAPRAPARTHPQTHPAPQ